MLGIGNSGRCPGCGARAITFRKSLFLPAWAKWPCSACALPLKVSMGRRMVVGASTGVLMGLGFISARNDNWWLAALFFLASVTSWTFDKAVADQEAVR